jgi:hypothetical protein
MERALEVKRADVLKHEFCQPCPDTDRCWVDLLTPSLLHLYHLTCSSPSLLSLSTPSVGVCRVVIVLCSWLGGVGVGLVRVTFIIVASFPGAAEPQ